MVLILDDEGLLKGHWRSEPSQINIGAQVNVEKYQNRVDAPRVEHKA